MVKVKEDLTGRTFGRLTVLEQADDYINPQGEHIVRWLCECSCKQHNQVKVTGSKLKNGHTKSCGCLVRDKASETHKMQNKFNITDYEYGIGWTNNTNKEFYFDLDDYDKIKNYTWYEHINKYNGYHTLMTGKHTKMTSILGFKGYDHINRNPLDNRKENLRKCTTTENIQNSSLRNNNTSGIIGVSWNKNKNKWRARIVVNGQEKSLGYFVNKDDAIRIRLNAEAKYFKEFSPQQHLFEQYGIVLTNKEENNELQ